jgi:hypothetical protein
MDQCNKNCPSGYLKDLFGCDICECSDQCPPFSCNILCPEDVGFAKSKDGCNVQQQNQNHRNTQHHVKYIR